MYVEESGARAVQGEESGESSEEQGGRCSDRRQQRQLSAPDRRGLRGNVYSFDVQYSIP